MHALSTRLDRFSTGVGWITAWFVSFMVVIQFAIVFLRYIFGINLIFAQDTVQYLHALIFLLGAGYTLLRDRHVRVDILYRSLTPAKRDVVDAIGVTLFVLPFCGALIYYALPYALRSWEIWEAAREATGLHLTYLLKSTITVFAFLLALQAFSTLLKTLCRAVAARSSRM